MPTVRTLIWISEINITIEMTCRLVKYIWRIIGVDFWVHPNPDTTQAFSLSKKRPTANVIGRWQRLQMPPTQCNTYICYCWKFLGVQKVLQLILYWSSWILFALYEQLTCYWFKGMSTSSPMSTPLVIYKFCLFFVLKRFNFLAPWQVLQPSWRWEFVRVLKYYLFAHFVISSAIAGNC